MPERDDVETSENNNRRQLQGLPVIRHNVAGIDLGSERHWVCAATLDRSGREHEIYNLSKRHGTSRMMLSGCKLHKVKGVWATAKLRRLATSIALFHFFGMLAAAQRPYTTWSTYLGNDDSSHYSALKQINRSNVNKLQVAWTYSTDDQVTYIVNPIVVGHTIYVIAKNFSVVAL